MPATNARKRTRKTVGPPHQTEPPTTREELGGIIAVLPDATLGAAKRLLLALIDDPILRGFMAAPLDPEPITDEEREGFEEARRDREAGRLLTEEQVFGKRTKASA